jgi:hypothetical protein
MKVGFDLRSVFVLGSIDVNLPSRTNGGDHSKGVSRAVVRPAVLGPMWTHRRAKRVAPNAARDGWLS